MIDFDDVTKENIKENNLTTNFWSSIHNINNWRLWIRKSKFIIQFNKLAPDIDKIYLSTKDPYEVKYQFLIHKRESAGLEHFNGSKAFIE